MRPYNYMEYVLLKFNLSLHCVVFKKWPKTNLKCISNSIKYVIFIDISNKILEK